MLLQILRFDEVNNGLCKQGVTGSIPVRSTRIASTPPRAKLGGFLLAQNAETRFVTENVPAKGEGWLERLGFDGEWEFRTNE